jgi:hypothetical protein
MSLAPSVRCPSTNECTQRKRGNSMNRLTKGALAALAAMSIAVVGCQEQGVDGLESFDTLPSMDMMLPTQSPDDMTAPSDEASPSES